MASVSYSFIDIAVLDPVRERFAAGDALAILSADLKGVIWANGPGAALLGFEAIEAAIGADAGLPLTARRQIAATPGFPDIGRERSIAVRLGRGVTTPITTLQASAIQLPGGEDAILLAQPSTALRLRDAETRAAAAVQGFDAADQYAALIDAEGSITAASSGFGQLGISAATLAELVTAVRGESDRLVKRLINAEAHRLPAAIARLTDDPAIHLLVVVDEVNDLSPGAPAPTIEAELAKGDEPVAGAEATAEPSETLLSTEPKDGPADAAQEPPPAKEEDVAEMPATKEQSATLGETPTERLTGTVRFAWRTDAEGRFTALSDSFVEAVGPAAADVMGRRFRDVSNAFGLDPDGRISALLERRDTWSGRTVYWPLAGRDLKVPVDLAALPIYGRGRVFEGFHGFGLARMGDAITDPEGIGLVLTPDAPVPGAERPVAAETESPEPQTGPQQPEPQPPAEEPAADDDRKKVVHLAERRDGARENGLSPTEQNAFREIGDRLRLANTDQDDRPDETEDTVEPARDQADATHPTEDAEAAATEPVEADAPQSGAETQTVPSSNTDQPTADETEGGTGPATGAETGLPADAFLPSAFSGAVSATGGDTLLLERLPLPILIHSGDALHYANRAFFDLTGHESLASLERTGGIETLFADTYETADTANGERCLRLQTQDDETIDVQAHLQSVPWKDGRALLLAMSPDGTQKKAVDAPSAPAAEVQPQDNKTAELQLHLAEMRAIVDTATDGVAIIDNDGMVRSTNRPAEALFGFEAEDVTGKPFTALFAIESQRAVQEYLNNLSDNGVASVLNDGLEVIGREAQGRFIPLFMTIGRLPHQGGYCAVLRDITQWKRAAEELTQARAEAERASAQKTEFLARVSHEIRTPLNAIIGFSELMLDEKFGPIGNDRYRDYLHDINRSGNHVLDLVNDLLDISKIEAGEQEMHYEAVPLNDVLGQTVAMMQPQANRERVIIRSSFASSLPDVVADPRSVRQIALNLLSNAIRYTQAGGQVIVSTAYHSDGSVIMRVRDTGVGMSSAEIEEALKPFKQINTLKRKRGDGTGLGLPLTRAMVEANRASFSISSVPDKGTLVEVSFPPNRVLAD